MVPPDNTDPTRTRSILVTDSGLGGLSVFNDIANRLEKGSPWQRVRLVYVNAWPAPHRGYNHFSTQEQKARIFNNALHAMAEFEPDVILIACNTLSVIYPHTHFSASSGIRVEGIVDHGVQMIYKNLTADPESMAVILGTPTTIDAKSHENELTRLGIDKERIVNIGCTNLAGWIEREPFSPKVNEMIRQFVTEAAKSLGNFSGKVYAALCCTHFGYRQKLFERAFTELVNARVTMLNPNLRMARLAVASGQPSSSFHPQMEIQIVSKAEWTDEQIGAYVELLPNISMTTRTALTKYKHDTQLFSVE